jgi:hypothetical protein
VLVFYRSIHTELALTLTSDESLGLHNVDWWQDHDLIEGQVSLQHVSSGVRFPLLVSLVPEATPTVPNNVFRGYALMSELPNGVFQIQGRCRDIAGNYTILGAVSVPQGNEREIDLKFAIADGIGRFPSPCRLELENHSNPLTIGFEQSNLAATFNSC